MGAICHAIPLVIEFYFYAFFCDKTGPNLQAYQALSKNSPRAVSEKITGIRKLRGRNK